MNFRKNINFFLIFALFFLSIFSSYASSDENIGKVFKITGYKYDDMMNYFIPYQYGSSVYMGSDLVYTNAHVVLDEEEIPLENYSICRTIDFKEKPKCFSVGELLYYDTKNDLAVLKIESEDDIEKVNFSKKELEIGDIVKVYGYPSNGGSTISYTEGKISGYENGLYKIDANVDSGNSGGGVFDEDGNLIGISVSVKVGYTTMGYIIPLDKINDFKNKKNNITEYNNGLDENFLSYFKMSNFYLEQEVFANNDFEIKDISKYGFDIQNYFIDNDKNFYVLSMCDDDSTIDIGNIRYISEEEVSLEILEDSYKKSLEYSKEIGIIDFYKIKKINYKGKDSIVSISKQGSTFSIFLCVEKERNNYILINFYSDNSKSKGLSMLFGNGLILKNSKLIEEQNNSTESLSYNNLKIGDLGTFSLTKSLFYSDALISLNPDIEVVSSITNNYFEGYEEIENTEFESYTLEKYLKYYYDYFVENYYSNDISIRKTSSGDYYLYFFYKINESKYSSEIDEEGKKYGIDVIFLDVKDDSKTYINSLYFVFDKVESKEIIDNFIDSFSTTSGEIPFEIGDIEIGTNLITEEEFIFE